MKCVNMGIGTASDLNGQLSMDVRYSALYTNSLVLNAFESERFGKGRQMLLS